VLFVSLVHEPCLIVWSSISSFHSVQCLTPLLLHSVHHHLTKLRIQSDDISRTAKFMSSPLVQSLASSRPVQVKPILLVPVLLRICHLFAHKSPLPFRYIYNALQTKLSCTTLTKIRRILFLRYIDIRTTRHYRHTTTHILIIDRASSICTSAGVQQCIILVAARRAYPRTGCCIPVVGF